MLAHSELQAGSECGSQSQRQFAVKAAYHISTLPDFQAFERGQKDPNPNQTEPNRAKRAAGEPLASATFASCLGLGSFAHTHRTELHRDTDTGGDFDISCYEEILYRDTDASTGRLHLTLRLDEILTKLTRSPLIGRISTESQVENAGADVDVDSDCNVGSELHSQSQVAAYSQNK